MFSLFKDTRDVLSIYGNKGCFLYLWIHGMFYLSMVTRDVFSIYGYKGSFKFFKWISGTMNGYKRDVYLCFNTKDVLSIYGWIYKRFLSMFEF